MARLEERSGNYHVTWIMGGRGGKRQSVTFETLPRAEQAQRIAEAHKHLIDRQAVYAAVLGVTLPTLAPEQPKRPTVAAFATTWLDSRTRITPGTKQRYRRQLDTEILPRVGEKPIDEVTGSHIAGMLNELRATRKDTTVTRYYAIAHSLFAFALAEKLIGDNPVARTDFVRDLLAHDDTGDDGHVYLTVAEFRLIYAAIVERDRPLLRMLADTGARWSEATAVDVRDVVLTGETPGVWIRQAWKQNEDGTWYRGATKGRNRRFVPIPRRLVAELLPLVEGRPGDALLFRAPRGGRMVHSNFRTRVWLPALAKASRCVEHQGNAVEVVECGCRTRLRQSPTPHDLRHTHVAWLIAAGRPLAAIARRIGHHSTTITERVYAGILPEVDDATVAALDGMDDLDLATVDAVVAKRRPLRPPVSRGRRLVRRAKA